MGKAVQYPCIPAHRPDCLPVVLLIQEKSCFLPVLHINLVTDRILNNLNSGIKRLTDKAFNQRHALLLTHLCIAALIHAAHRHPKLCQLRFALVNDHFLHTVNSECQRLYNQHIGKLVHNDSRKEIRLPEDQAAAAHIYRLLTVRNAVPHTVMDPAAVNHSILFAAHHPHSQHRPVINETNAKAISIKILNLDQVSIGIFTGNCINLIVINPGSACLQTSSRSFFYPYCCTHSASSSCLLSVCGQFIFCGRIFILCPKRA